MPLPLPKPKEQPTDFISRCMVNPTMIKEYPTKMQRLSVCAVLYRKK